MLKRPLTIHEIAAHQVHLYNLLCIINAPYNPPYSCDAFTHASKAASSGDARAVRLSRPVRAAALLRRNGRLCRRLEAPRRLAASGQQPTGDLEGHRIVENGEDGHREGARHLGLDGGDDARQPRSPVQQRIERTVR